MVGAEPEENFSGWSFYFDNDFFALGNRDNDYTGGFAYKRSGTRVKSSLLSVDGWLESLDELTGVADLYHRPRYLKTHSQEFGVTLFTPEDLDVAAPINNQHPYASLFFINNSRLVIDPDTQVSYQSTLTLGLLGLPLAGEIQTELHRILGAVKPEGWDNQISSGGEPTFRYSVSRSKNHSLPASLSKKLELKSSAEANVGFTTDVGVALALRAGNLQSPWWTFNLHNAEYISLGSPNARALKSGIGESYFWAGMSLKYRIYNAILQGQFKTSEVTYDRSELEQIVAEIWMGYTHEFESGWQLSGFIRARSAEIDLDNIDGPVWGGFIIGQSF